MNEHRGSLAIAIVFLALLALPGCLLGAVAVGAGVVAATSEDTSQVDIRGSREAVFDVTAQEIERMGQITASDPARGLIEGEVGGSSLKVAVFVVGEFTRLRITARKVAGTLPDLDLANRLASDVNRSF